MNMKKILTLSLFALSLCLSSQSFATVIYGFGNSHVFGGNVYKIQKQEMVLAIFNLHKRHPVKNVEGKKHHEEQNQPPPEEQLPPVSYNDDEFKDHNKLPPSCDNEQDHPRTVPEPGTIFILGLGLIGVFFINRRKTRKDLM